MVNLVSSNIAVSTLNALLLFCPYEITHIKFSYYSLHTVLGLRVGKFHWYLSAGMRKRKLYQKVPALG
jgi:hypothetical protein